MLRPGLRTFCIPALLLVLVACAPTGTHSPLDEAVPSATDEDILEEDILDDSDFDEGNPVSEERVPDPLEVWNRMWFGFNDFFYLRIMKPVYTVYTAVVHEDIRSGLGNAMRNLEAPVRIVNSLLQLEFAQAVVEFGRFVVNSTVGGLGLAEIVPPEKALVPIHLESANFGSTLAKWGFGEGMYLVWPVLGPSTLRDTFGLAGDAAAGLSFWAAELGDLSPLVDYGVTGTLLFNEYAGVIDQYETLTQAAVEPYISMRDAYIKIRRNALLLPRSVW
jgi:phospholipid-binding lipoprotein MlaA